MPNMPSWSVRPQGTRPGLAAHANPDRLCPKERISLLEGEVLSENTTTLKMCGEFRFHIEASLNDRISVS
jgi:hypothetical protein